MFSPEEIERYRRHIVLKGLGGPGQQRLKSARVLVVGAGGLGSPAIAYLAAAGVGALGIVDDDEVALSNLQRQIVHRTGDTGTPKTESARRFVADLNPHVSVTLHQMRIGPDTAESVLAGYDLVLDGSDSFDTKLAVSDAAFRRGVPDVLGAVSMLDGQVTVLAPHLGDADGRPNPTYRCLYPDRPDPEQLPSCEAMGIVGPLTGVVGSMMAMEAVKLITGLGTALIGRLVVYSGRDGTARTLRYRWRADNPLNGAAIRPTAGARK